MTEEKQLEIKNGEFVLIEYTGYVKETNEIFDTTYETLAKEANIYTPRHKYGPVLVIVGEKWLPEGLEDSLIGKKENEEYEVEVPPEKGFGIRDSKKIVTTTIRKLRESGVKGDLVTGNIIEVDGKPAIIRAVVSGRVMLDFNPPLAGKHLKYNVKVSKILKTLEEKVKALVNNIDPNVLEKTKIRISKKNKKITFNFGENALLSPNLHLSKKTIADNILKYISEMEEVTFVDKIKRAKEEEKTGSEPSAQEAEQKQY